MGHVSLRTHIMQSVPLSPVAAFVLGFGIIALAWLAVVVYDVGWPARVLSEDERFLSVWWFTFTESGPIELVQWLFLAIGAFLATRLGAMLPEGTEPARFWTLMGLAFMFLLLEDAGDLRQHLARIGHDLAAIHGANPHRTYSLIEKSCYLALAGLPCYAFLRYGWHIIWQPGAARLWLVLGFGLYGLSAIGSALRYQADFYVRTGSWLQDKLFGGGLTRIELSEGHLPDSFYLMDYLIEESLELAAVTCLIVALLLIWQKQRGPKPVII